MCKENLNEKHCHTHCECEQGDSIEKQQKTLKILLSHWIEHNKSHEEGFEEWIDKCGNMGKEEVGKYIEKAVEYMKNADDMLKEAEKHM